MSTPDSPDGNLPASGDSLVLERRIAISVSSDLPDVLLPAGMACQIVGETRPTPLVNCRPWFVGLHSERGVAVPTFDMQIWLGQPRSTAGKVLVLSMKGFSIGLIADKSPRLADIAAATVDDQPLVETKNFCFPSQLACHLRPGGRESGEWRWELDAAGWYSTAVKQVALYS